MSVFANRAFKEAVMLKQGKMRSLGWAAIPVTSFLLKVDRETGVHRGKTMDRGKASSTSQGRGFGENPLASPQNPTSKTPAVETTQLWNFVTLGN